MLKGMFGITLTMVFLLHDTHPVCNHRVTTMNISRVTVNCFPLDVIVFAMLPVHGIWWETVSLLPMNGRAVAGKN